MVLLVVRAEVFASLELVNRAAIRALDRTGVGHAEVHLGVAVPYFHAGLGAGAEDAAPVVEVGGEQFDGGGRTHAI